jgi:hypothetical protein
MPTAPRSRAPASVLGELRVAAAVLVAGLMLGGIWALWAPALAHSADLGEAKVTVDGVLALLALGAGLLTAVILTVVPGPRPAVRLAIILAAATVANLLAVLVGAARGLSPGAPGVALLWPLTSAVLTVLRTLASFVISPDGDGPWRRRRDEHEPNGQFSETPPR